MAQKTDPSKAWKQKSWVGLSFWKLAEEEMQETGSSSGGGFENQWWLWWAVNSVTQLGWGISSYRRGFSGDSHLMPFKAFAVASLFVGSAASASVAALQASGIHKVEDLMQVGANIRTGLGIPSRVPEKKADDL